MDFKVNKVTDNILGITHIHVEVDGGPTFGVDGRVLESGEDWFDGLVSRIKKGVGPIDTDSLARLKEDLEKIGESTPEEEPAPA